MRSFPKLHAGSINMYSHRAPGMPGLISSPENLISLDSAQSSIGWYRIRKTPWIESMAIA